MDGEQEKRTVEKIVNLKSVFADYLCNEGEGELRENFFYRSPIIMHRDHEKGR